MSRLLSFFLFLGAFSATGFCAVPQELGEGLSYLRIRNLAADIKAEPPATATVIDLRGTEGGSIEALGHLRTWMTASSHGPLRLVLIDSVTGTEILDILNRRQRFAITVAATSPALTADVSVATSLVADRQARDALDAGKPLKDLLGPKIAKRRYDEASMVKDHANGVPLPESPPDLSELPEDVAAPASKAPATPAEAASVKPPPAPPTEAVPYDAVLQRAIHVFLALTALKKI